MSSIAHVYRNGKAVVVQYADTRKTTSARTARAYHLKTNQPSVTFATQTSIFGYVSFAARLAAAATMVRTPTNTSKKALMPSQWT